MDYKKYYESLILSRQLLDRKKGNGIYYESHHILPRSLGGTNEKENLVLLTFKEHFIAHLLLTKCYEAESRKKMIYAFWMMCNSKHKNLSSNMYQKYKEEFYFEKNQIPFSEETRRKMRAAKIGKKSKRKGRTLIEIQGVDAARKTKEKMSDAMKGNIPWNKGISTINLQNHNEKKILQIDSKTKKILKEWNSAREVFKELHISFVAISKVCNDIIGRHKTAGGFIWEFKK